MKIASKLLFHPPQKTFYDYQIFLVFAKKIIIDTSFLAISLLWQDGLTHYPCPILKKILFIFLIRGGEEVAINPH